MVLTNSSNAYAFVPNNIPKINGITNTTHALSVVNAA